MSRLSADCDVKPRDLDRSSDWTTESTWNTAERAGACALPTQPLQLCTVTVVGLQYTL